MRLSHFETLAPVCPRCRTTNGQNSSLRLFSVFKESGGHILEGVVHCSNTGCFMEFPIIDGIPILVPDVAGYLRDNVSMLMARTDLSETIESILGDCAGPGSAFDTQRQHISTYAWDSYGDLDPDESAEAGTGDAKPGAVVRCLDAGLALTGAAPQSPAIDIGCSVGRTSFELAARSDGLVLGVDLHLPMLRMARTVLECGVVRYPRRRVGIVYDRREFEVAFDDAERVDFWACDAMAPPFREGGFGTAVALNVLDCVNAPRDFLDRLSGLLRPGGTAVLSTPYDWSTGATPVETWIGGHSQRGPDGGASEPFVRALLTDGAHPQSVTGLSILGEIAEFPWQARLHDRSIVSYAAHVLALTASG